jgi:hypothetical protein
MINALILGYKHNRDKNQGINEGATNLAVLALYLTIDNQVNEWMR